MRARAGGQFLLVWHDDLCDENNWVCNWEPFVYNGLEYNDGYNYWHPNPPQDHSNSTVKSDVWYTIKLRVNKEPFTFTGEAYSQEDEFLGSLIIDSMNDLSFDDIKYCVMTTYPGGTFYVRNLTLTSNQANTTPKVSTSPSTGKNMFSVESNSTVTSLAFNSSSNELSFYVSGESGTRGYVKLAIARTLLQEPQNLKVQLDGKPIEYDLTQTEEFWILDFNYNHSAHQVNVILPKTAINSQSVNPLYTLSFTEWIAASIIATLLLLVIGLLLLGLRKPQKNH